MSRIRAFTQLVGTCVLAFAPSLSSVSWAACPANLGGSSTPNNAFLIHSNDTVSHIETGLMWKRCNEGKSGAGCATGSSSVMNWSSALAASTASFAGFSDWRLPNKQELQLLIDAACDAPAINPTVFPAAAAGWTWTGTTLHDDPQNAWVVDFGQGLGNADRKSVATNHVRLVRSGQRFDLLRSPQPQTLNVDASDAASRFAASSDGALVLRYLLGLRGTALTQGALGSGATRDAAQIEVHIAANLAYFDVDLDGRTAALTDGLMIIRRLLGLDGVALTSRAKNSIRSDTSIQFAIDELKY